MKNNITHGPTSHRLTKKCKIRHKQSAPRKKCTQTKRKQLAALH